MDVDDDWPFEEMPPTGLLAPSTNHQNLRTQEGQVGSKCRKRRAVEHPRLADGMISDGFASVILGDGKEPGRLRAVHGAITWQCTRVWR